MSQLSYDERLMAAQESADRSRFLGHPTGLFLLFLVEMWERFSYYGMRGILVLYLTSPTGGMRKPPAGAAEGFNPGPGWSDPDANNAYGWYTGLAYLTPIIGGMIADKFIGTHRSMIMGGLLIAMGHIALGFSGMAPIAGGAYEMTAFVFGLALIVIGTGHFKPSVSVMVGQLYKQGDARRETAFGIFYMGINLGSAIQTYIVGTLGERVGWHWGFGAAAVGMLFGLALYMVFRSRLLAGIGEARVPQRAKVAPTLLPIGLVVAALAAVSFHKGYLKSIDTFVSDTTVASILAGIALAWAIFFTVRQRPEDRGPVATIFVYILFNAVFWLSFEQAGSSINLFTDRSTDRTTTVPSSVLSFASSGSVLWGGVIAAVGLVGVLVSVRTLITHDRAGRHGRAGVWIVGVLAAAAVTTIGILKATGNLGWVRVFELIPTTWFQSINPWLIVAFAPVTGVMWTWLTRKNANPGQPYKIAFGLILVGLGYLFMVAAAMQAREPALASMWLIAATYFAHTMGEIVLSPTGLSYVTKAAPKEHMSLLMGVWFMSSFIANLGAGKVAAMVQPIIEGKKQLPWHLAPDASKPGNNTEADFYFLFVITSCTAGLLILALGPFLKKLQGGRE